METDSFNLINYGKFLNKSSSFIVGTAMDINSAMAFMASVDSSSSKCFLIIKFNVLVLISLSRVVVASIPRVVHNTLPITLAVLYLTKP